MTTQALAIGIDVGTSGVRVIVTNAQGKQVSMGSSRTAEPLNRPAHWWQACVESLDHALDPIDASSVVAMAIDGTSGTLLAVDSAGNAIGDALMYNDSAIDPKIHAQLKACVPAGNPAGSATSGLAKAIELQSRPGVAKVIHQADWIAGNFTGDYSHSDENNALKTGYDPINRLWPDWITGTSMQTPLLPRVHPVATATGTLSNTLCRQTGMSDDTVVYTGTTDGCASFLATGAERQGEAVTALGTTLTLKQLVSNPVFNAEYGVYSHRIGDLWLAGGASNTGGAVLDAYFSTAQLVSLSNAINTEVATNLNYYPLLKPGERFPINDPQLPPRLTPRPENDGEFLQGMLEGIANIEKLGFERVNELSGTSLASIRSVGSGAANTHWTQIRRNIIGVPFEAANSVDAAAGTARLAWMGFNQDNPT